MSVLDKLNMSFQKYGVKMAYLFGSQKEKGIEFLRRRAVESGKGSDLDIGVVFEKVADKTFLVYGEIYADLVDIFQPFHLELFS